MTNKGIGQRHLSSHSHRRNGPSFPFNSCSEVLFLLLSPSILLDSSYPSFIFSSWSMPVELQQRP
ncbi:hypothetical protein L195_g033616 [Trifolium pratense]|uniref:Uncharacterized protein n=1 Tax=Trifolium pratense TaxID=57577 RepID=A0A2K3LGI3_TRIPR|nr:hypothetical protein L195_g033616 [Trifolium pratense]